MDMQVKQKVREIAAPRDSGEGVSTTSPRRPCGGASGRRMDSNYHRKKAMSTFKYVVCAVLASCLFVGCGSQDADIRNTNGGWRTTFNGHQYVRFSAAYRGSAVHDPDCPCREKERAMLLVSISNAVSEVAYRSPYTVAETDLVPILVTNVQMKLIPRNTR